MIAFNKQQTHFESITFAVNHFLNIARQVVQDPNSHQHFNAQSLAMLLFGAKKNQIRYTHWQHQSENIWGLHLPRLLKIVQSLSII